MLGQCWDFAELESCSMRPRDPPSYFLCLTTDDSNLQIEYADQSREADRLVNEGIIEYLRQARTPQEIEIAGRLRVIGRISQGAE